MVSFFWGELWVILVASPFLSLTSSYSQNTASSFFDFPFCLASDLFFLWRGNISLEKRRTQPLHLTFTDQHVAHNGYQLLIGCHRRSVMTTTLKFYNSRRHNIIIFYFVFYFYFVIFIFLLEPNLFILSNKRATNNCLCCWEDFF